MTDKENIIKKIRRLLTMTEANGASENEVAIALATIDKLLLKYNLTEDEVINARIDDKEWELECIKSLQRQSYYQECIEQIILNFYFVDIVRTQRYDRKKGCIITDVQLFGEPANVKVAEYIFNFLMRVYPILWKAYKCDNPHKKNQSKAYYFGLTAGIYNKIKRDREQLKWSAIIQEKLEYTPSNNPEELKTYKGRTTNEVIQLKDEERKKALYEYFNDNVEIGESFTCPSEKENDIFVYTAGYIKGDELEMNQPLPDYSNKSDTNKIQ